MENILSESNADETDDSIRNEIDEQFASEKGSISKSWDDEMEILDSIGESERIRKKLLKRLHAHNKHLKEKTKKIRKRQTH